MSTYPFPVFTSVLPFRGRGRTVCAAAFVLGTLSLERVARADAPAGAPPPSGATSVIDTGTGPNGAAATPGTTPASAAPPVSPVPAAPAAPPVDRTDDPHLRWGVSPGVGLFFGSNPRALIFGAEGRLGYQVNSMLGVYGTAGFAAGFGFGASSDEKSASGGISGVSYWYLGANAEALLADPLFVAGGFGIGGAAWGSLSGSANTATSSASGETIAAGGLTPQGNVRVGLGFGNRNPTTGKKSGFTLALDFRVLWAPNSVKETASGGPNGASVKSDTAAFGFAPMLMLGYDLR